MLLRPPSKAYPLFPPGKGAIFEPRAALFELTEPFFRIPGLRALWCEEAWAWQHASYSDPDPGDSLVLPVAAWC